MSELNNFYFKKHERLRKRVEFQAVFDNKLSKADKFIILYIKPNKFKYTRLGIVIGKKSGNSVKRNRFKRIVREAFRKIKSLIPENLDILVLPRKPLEISLKSQDIEKSFVDLLQKLLNQDFNS